jgi:hypothetical protein
VVALLVVVWAGLAGIVWARPEFPPASAAWVARYQPLDHGEKVGDFDDLFVQAMCLSEAPVGPCDGTTLGFYWSVFEIFCLAVGTLIGVLSWGRLPARAALAAAMGCALFVLGERVALGLHAMLGLGTDGQILLAVLAFAFPWGLVAILERLMRGLGFLTFSMIFALSGGFFAVPVSIAAAVRVSAAASDSIIVALSSAALAPLVALVLLALVGLAAVSFQRSPT